MTGKGPGKLSPPTSLYPAPAGDDGYLRVDGIRGDHRAAPERRPAMRGSAEAAPHPDRKERTVRQVPDGAAFPTPATGAGPTTTGSSSAGFTALLDDHIQYLEQSYRDADPESWYPAALRLRAAAITIGAQRIEATTARLLESEGLDAPAFSCLMNQLRSEGRVFALMQSALCEEQAFADTLLAHRTV